MSEVFHFIFVTVQTSPARGRWENGDFGNLSNSNKSGK